MNRMYDRKMQYLGLVLLTVICLAISILLVKDFVKTKDYVPVSAILEEVSTTYGNGSKSNMMQYKHAKFRFEYDGKQWETSRPTFFMSQKDTGKVMTIKCNPDNPLELENTAYRGAELAILAVCIISFFAIKKSV